MLLLRTCDPPLAPLKVILSGKGLIFLLQSLLEVLDRFKDTEFWNVNQGIMAPKSAADGSYYFRIWCMQFIQNHKHDF